MSSNVSQENAEEIPGNNQDDDFVQVENPQPPNFDQNVGAGNDTVSYLVGRESPEDSLIKQVLGYFMKNTCHASADDPRVEIALDMSLQLIERDYVVIKIDNKDGILSTFYPSVIPFLNGEISKETTSILNSLTKDELTELIRKSYRARCRQRFPVPVIMYNDKCICRSSTLAGVAEVYGKMALDVIRPGNVLETDGSLDEEIAAQVDIDDNWRAINEMQIADVTLLQRLKIGTIVDLMVENRKSKLGVPVTSSEKVDKANKYHATFSLLSLPFPGCEFFKEFHNQNYKAEGLYFNWDQPMCDAELTVPEYPALNYLNIDWNNYKQWDLVQMTQNYIKYILKYLQYNDSGVLIHCISGWDRTPLFISILRLSLWADGVIHKSLDVREILFLTLAYDWMLFGHHLADRLNKNEDILLFCFNFLKHLTGDEYSLLSPKMKSHSQPVGENKSAAETKTEEFSHFDDSDGTYLPRSEDLPPFSPEPVGFPEESNDSMDFRLESPASLIIMPESPPEIAFSPERAGSVPMDVCDDLESRNRTTPVEMPCCSNVHSRCGVESNSIGSWQVVSATGSVRGSDSQSEVDTVSSQGSYGTTNGDEYVSRKMRLTLIRRLFYRCYYQTLTDKHVTYQKNSTVLKGILSNLADIAQMLNQQRQ